MNKPSRTKSTKFRDAFRQAYAFESKVVANKWSQGAPTVITALELNALDPSKPGIRVAYDAAPDALDADVDLDEYAKENSTSFFDSNGGQDTLPGETAKYASVESFTVQKHSHAVDYRVWKWPHGRNSGRRGSMGGNAFGARDVNGNNFVELKKEKNLDGQEGEYKKVTYWMEAFLAGCKSIVVGLQDSDATKAQGVDSKFNEGLVTAVRHYKTDGNKLLSIDDQDKLKIALHKQLAWLKYEVARRAKKGERAAFTLKVTKQDLAEMTKLAPVTLHLSRLELDFAGNVLAPAASPAVSSALGPAVGNAAASKSIAIPATTVDAVLNVFEGKPSDHWDTYERRMPADPVVYSADGAGETNDGEAAEALKALKQNEQWNQSQMQQPGQFGQNGYGQPEPPQTTNIAEMKLPIDEVKDSVIQHLAEN